MTTATERRRGTPWIVGVLWASTVLIAAFASTFSPSVVATPHGDAGDPLAVEIGFLAVYVTLGSVGAVVAMRRPRHVMGWLFLLSAWLMAVTELAHGYAHHAIALEAAPTLIARSAALVSVVLFNPPFVLLTLYLPLVFPDGRLLSPRWRVVVAALASAVVAITVVELLRPGPIVGYPGFTNPLGVAGTDELLSIVGAVADAVFFPIVLGVAVAVVLRFRRATPLERQQFKWVALPAGVLLVFLPLNELFIRDIDGPLGVLGDVLFFAAFAGLPVGLAIGVLRYRLYDIDRILSRTVSYATLTVAMVATYAIAVVTLGATLRALSGGTPSELVVAASTLAAAAVFQPTRRRIQRVVDRRFNRAHYDAASTVVRFGARLRDEFDPEALLGEMRTVVTASVQPTSASVWVAPPAQDRAVAPATPLAGPGPVPQRERHPGPVLSPYSQPAG